MANFFLIVAAAMQGVAVAYGAVLLGRRRGAAGAWLFLLGAMLSMLVAESSSIESAPTRALPGIRIVLVDDEPDVRAAVSRLLEQRGAEVTTLDSGRTIESTLVARRPHLLVLDIGMPGEDGYTLMRRIRRLPATDGGSVPAISLTAHARAEDRARALAAGFQDHLPKPVDLPRLLGAIRELAARPSPA